MKYAIFLLALCGCAVEVETATPRSLIGTEVDGEFSGTFVLDENAQRTFDYFLTAEGELDDAALDRWADAELEKKLSGRALDDARDGWRIYRNYRRAAQDILSAGRESELPKVIDAHLGDAPLAASEKLHLVQRSQPALGAVEPDAYRDARRKIEAARLLGAGAATIDRLRIEAFGEEAAARLSALDQKRARAR